MNLFVNVAAGATLGLYSIHFEGVRASDPNGRPVSVSNTDGRLTLKTSYGAPIVPQGVLNGASLLPGPIAPGELITIMGAAIGSVSSPGSLTFNGFPAPVLYAGDDQANAVVPFGIAGLATTTLNVANPSGTPAILSLLVAFHRTGRFYAERQRRRPGRNPESGFDSELAGQSGRKRVDHCFLRDWRGPNQSAGHRWIDPGHSAFEAPSHGFGPDRRRSGGNSVRGRGAGTDFRRFAGELPGADADLAWEFDSASTHRR